MEKQIRVLSRGLQVVECIRQEAPVSLSQLSQTTALPKSTLLRILNTLQHHGWVYRGLSDEHYRLSFRLRCLADNILAADALAEAAAPILDELKSDLFWPSYVAVRRGLFMEVVERTRKKQVVAVRPEVVGVKVGILRSALGHAYLAFCSEIERNEIIERVIAAGGEPGGLAADKAWLDALLQRVRQHGYGVRKAHEWPGPAHAQGAIAVPVFLQGRIKACINIAWPGDAVEQASIESQFYPRLREAADRLSAVLENDNPAV